MTAAPLPRVFGRAALTGLEPLARSYDATSPDLAGFRARDGRLVLWHGAADQAIPPAGTVAYHRAVVAAAGGLASARGFARLFLVPGMYHCAGGTGADRFDLLTATINWVERGQAPESTLAWRPAPAGAWCAPARCPPGRQPPAGRVTAIPPTRVRG